jgi:uncharacterized protein YaiI (UPF0178 family)
MERTTGYGVESWVGHGVGQVNEHDLIVTNTSFQQKRKSKTSGLPPRSKHWHLVDHVIVRRSDTNDVILTRAMRVAECWTDHV